MAENRSAQISSLRPLPPFCPSQIDAVVDGEKAKRNLFEMFEERSDEAIQKIVGRRRWHGLLRFARNDGPSGQFADRPNGLPTQLTLRRRGPDQRIDNPQFWKPAEVAVGRPQFAHAVLPAKSDNARVMDLRARDARLGQQGAQLGPM